MTSVSTVSCGTTGTYEPYGFPTPPYGTYSAGIGSFGVSRVESVKPYGGTGVCENRRPRSAPVCVSANLGRRARRRALCGRGRARRRSGVAA